MYSCRARGGAAFFFRPLDAADGKEQPVREADILAALTKEFGDLLGGGAAEDSAKGGSRNVRGFHLRAVFKHRHHRQLLQSFVRVVLFHAPFRAVGKRRRGDELSAQFQIEALFAHVVLLVFDFLGIRADAPRQQHSATVAAAGADSGSQSVFKLRGVRDFQTSGKYGGIESKDSGGSANGDILHRKVLADNGKTMRRPLPRQPLAAGGVKFGCGGKGAFLSVRPLSGGKGAQEKLHFVSSGGDVHFAVHVSRLRC